MFPCPDCHGVRGLGPPCRGCGGTGIVSCCEGAVGCADDVPGSIKDWLATPDCVVPLDDLRAHDALSDECWCGPRLDGGILVHNSADGREVSERRPV